MRGEFDQVQDDIFKDVVTILVAVLDKTRSPEEAITLADFPNLHEVHNNYLALCLPIDKAEQTKTMLEMYYLMTIKTHKIESPEVIWQLAILKGALHIFSIMTNDNIIHLAYVFSGMIWLTASSNIQSTLHGRMLSDAIDNHQKM